MPADTTRQIGGVLLKPDATPFANATLTVYRDKRAVVPQGDSAIVDELLRTVLGPNGEVSMGLVPGQYLGQIRLSDADRYFGFAVPDSAGPFIIADLINTPPVNGALFLTLQDLALSARMWAESPDPIGADYGGNGTTDRSAKYWAQSLGDLAEQIVEFSATGIVWKDPVRAAADANVANTALINGAVIDGVTLSTGDRVLLFGQTDPANNGIWSIAASGAGVRSDDADTALEVAGMAMLVSEGTVYAGKQFACTARGEISLGTTPLPFVEISDVSTKADKTEVNALADEVAVKADETYVDALVDDAAGAPILDDEVYVEGFVADDEATVLLGFRKDGTVDVNDTYPLLDSVWAYVEVVEQGNGVYGVVWGWRRDGTFFVPSGGEPPVTSWSAYVNNGDVFVARDGLRAAITFDGAGYAGPLIEGDFCSYVDASNVEFVEEVKAASSLSSFLTKLRHIIMYGQSLSIGTTSTPTLTVVPPWPGRLVSFNNGPRTSSGSGLFADAPANLYAFVDLYERAAETPAAGLGATLVPHLDADEGLLISAHGVGGQLYTALKKGTTPYANLIGSVRRDRIMVSLNGLDEHETRHVYINHGQADRDAALAVYKANLVEWQTDLTADINAAAGQTGEVILVLDQISNWTGLGSGTSEVPFAQLEVALEEPTKFICVGPQYHLPTSPDGVHLTNVSSRRAGSYASEKIRRQIAGLDTLPLYCTGATRTGAVITLTMHVPVGPLVFDTTAVSDPGNYGFQWSQEGGTARSIASVAIDGSNIVITLDGDPGAPTAESIAIAMNGVADDAAGPTTGPRACLRDSASDLDAAGVPMPNWVCHQIIPVTL